MSPNMETNMKFWIIELSKDGGMETWKGGGIKSSISKNFYAFLILTPCGKLRNPYLI